MVPFGHGEFREGFNPIASLRGLGSAFVAKVIRWKEFGALDDEVPIFSSAHMPLNGLAVSNRQWGSSLMGCITSCSISGTTPGGRMVT